MRTKKLVTASKKLVSGLDAHKVRVIRDSRDGRKDYFLDKDDAHRLYQAGKLSFDVTNNCYFDRGTS